MAETRENEKKAERPRKPYETPKLTVYGDVAKLTQATKTGARPDGGHGSKSHTV